MTTKRLARPLVQGTDFREWPVTEFNFSNDIAFGKCPDGTAIFGNNAVVTEKVVLSFGNFDFKAGMSSAILGEGMASLG